MAQAGRYIGRAGYSGEPANEALAVTETDKKKFDKFCDKYGQTQGRMFREILAVYMNQPEIKARLAKWAAEDIGHTSPETT